MRAKPTANWRLLGTPLEWNKDVVYPIVHATNQPFWKEKGKVFMAHDPADVNVEGNSILLSAGEYQTIS